ncbi:hypothetical protein Btru_075303 [Bulinus truncatus]|nr:hypothetical protein Btru_075303 [Bulinus truncatus]
MESVDGGSGWCLEQCHWSLLSVDRVNMSIQYPQKTDSIILANNIKNECQETTPPPMKKQGSNIETPWLMSVEVACWTIGIILGGLLDSKLGPRRTMLLGAVLFNISLFLTYLTFEMTFVTFILALGVLTGIADGVLHSASLSFVVMWVDNYVGLAIGVATSSLGLGAVLINLIITRYINPMNVNPDATDGNLRIFTQPDVLDRVPRVFLILGTFSSVFHFMGFVFLQTRKNHTNSSECSHTLFCSQHLADNGKKSGNFCVGSVSNDNISKHAQVLNERDAKKSGNFSVGSVSNDNIDRHPQQLNERDHVTVIGEEVDTTVQDANDESDTAHLLPESEPDMGDELRNCSKCNLDTRCGRFEFLTVWKLMLRTKELYALVLLQFSMDYALVVVSHFYKLFGQTWLSDDRSLAILGTVMTLTTIFPKLLLGALQDKIGLKETWIIMTSGTTITSAFWYFTPRVNK